MFDDPPALEYKSLKSAAFLISLSGKPKMPSLLVFSSLAMLEGTHLSFNYAFHWLCDSPIFLGLLQM
jgi:hypothetical protein